MNSVSLASTQRRSPHRLPRPPHEGLVSATVRDTQLKRLLAMLQRSAEGTPDLRIDLPRGEALRMRTLVHRGTQRPVFKVASVKLDRVVQCESILECEAGLLLDVCPQVRVFGEQPVRVHYLIEGQWRSHIPDFAVLSDGVLTLLEIKFQKDVDDEVLARTRWMEDALGRLGANYRLLTETHIRQGNVVQNALRVLRRARHAVCEPQLLQALEKLREVGQLPLAAFGWSVADSLEAVCIAQLIARGQATVDAWAPLSETSYVRLADASNEEEGASWWPAASV